MLRRLCVVLIACCLGATAAPVRANDPLADLRKVLASMGTDAVMPLRIRFAVELPPGFGSDRLAPERRLGDLDVLVRMMAWSAGCQEVEDLPTLDSPVLTVEAKATSSSEFVKAAGAGEQKPALALTAQVEGRLVLGTRAGTWTFPFLGRATARYENADQALKARPPVVTAAAASRLLHGLDLIVAARERPRLEALLTAYDRVRYGEWLASVLKVLEIFEPAPLRTAVLDFATREDDDLAEPALEVLPHLGEEAHAALLRTPASGSLAYRWRRHRALDQIADWTGATPELLRELRRGLDDPQVLMRTLALRTLTTHAPEQAPDALIAALGDPHPSVRGHARLALEGLSGKQHGYSVEAWRRWAETRPTAGTAAPTTSAPPRAEEGPLLPFGLRTPETLGPARAAVTASLERLAAMQAADGGWPVGKQGYEHYGVGVTGLALLAFLTAGHDASGGPFATNVSRAVAHLRASQVESGRLGEARAMGYPTAHALATLALLHAWAANPSPTLQQTVQRAIAFTDEMRNPYFGWRYGVKAGDNDAFLTFACIQVHAAARTINQAATWAGRPAPFVYDTEAFAGARAFLERMIDPDDGATGYIQRGRPLEGYDVEPTSHRGGETSRRTLACAAALFFVWEGMDVAKPAPVHARVLETALSQPPVWRYGADLLGWWWGSLLATRLGPKHELGKRWAAGLTTALTTARASPTLVDEVRWAWMAGDAYAHALLVLCHTAVQQMPALESTRKDLQKVVGDAKAPAERRAAALRAWSPHARAKAVDVALAWIGERDEVRRAAAVDVLRTSPVEAAARAGALRKLAEKGSEPVKAAVVQALGALGTNPGAEQTALLAALRDPSHAVRRAALAAVESLEPVPGEAKDALVLLLKDEQGDGLRRLLAVVSRTEGDLPLEALERALTHPEADVRRSAFALLARVAGGPAASRSALLRGAEDPDATLRREALLALPALPAAEALPVLMARLRDPREDVALAAAQGLGRMVAAPELVEQLSKMLADPEPLPRRRAAQALARLGPAATGAGPALHAAVKAEVAKADKWDTSVVVALAEARYRVLRDASGTASLLQTVFQESPDLEVRVRALELLGVLPEAGAWIGEVIGDGLLEGGPLPYAILCALADLGTQAPYKADEMRAWAARITGPLDLKIHAEVAARRAAGD
jgi:HEAT repeat protein